jgi:O-antigen/teichoic acid export membrane protein
LWNDLQIIILIKKIFSYGFIEGIAKGLNKFILLALPLFLSTVDYGKIGLIIAIELFLPVISLLGFERAILRFYSEKKEFKNFKNTIFKSIRIVHLLILVLIGILYLLEFYEFAGLKVFPDLFLVVILVYFQGSNLFHINIIRVSEDHNKYFKARVFIQILRVILIFSLVYTFNSYLGYIIAALLTAIISNLFFTVTEKELNKKFNKRTFSTLFLFSWPFIFHGVAGSLLVNADKFILESYLSLTDVGLYTLTYSISSMMIFGYVGISVYLEPLIYKENDLKKRELLLDKFLFLAIFFGVFIFTTISISSIYILPLIYGVNYEKSIQYIPLLASGYLIYPFYLKANYKMIYEKKVLNIALVSVVSAIINIALNLFFIPKYGIVAAVLTTVISYVIQAILFVLISNKFKINKDFYEVITVAIMLCAGIYCRLSYVFIALGLILYFFYLLFNKLKYKIKF